ncbi:hypothetical protein VNI00_016256 [Paramarasmius palmivorus]|uniref:Glycoside hydrolase family 76 protein n=1 Tax=Paramarasmius palmivorus TaxID=297713 RepID=A0AAW0BFZ7_9AGAR
MSNVSFPIAGSRLTVSVKARSPAWRKPDITISQQDRVDLASAALDKGINALQSNGVFNYTSGRIDFGPYPSAYLHGLLAEFDISTQKMKYEDRVRMYFSRLESDSKGAAVAELEEAYGYAAARAYSAYRDPLYLGAAEKWWRIGTNATVSEADSLRVCNDTSIAGGMKDFTGSVQTTETALYLILTSLLAEATSNTTYLESATQTASFIRRHRYKDGIAIGGSLDPSSTSSCTPRSLDDDGDVRNTAFMIEGLAVLNSIMGERDKTYDGMIKEAISIATNRIPEWQDTDGILKSSVFVGTGSDPYLVRALTTVYTRYVDSISTDLRDLIQEFVGVQYNAVLDLATTSGTNQYVANWTGPPSDEFDAFGQTSAGVALVAGISLGENLVVSGSGSLGLPTPTATSGASNNESSSEISGGAIAGAVLGAVIAVTALVGLVFYLYRRRRRHRRRISMSSVLDEGDQGTDTNPTVTPFRGAGMEKSMPSPFMLLRPTPNRVREKSQTTTSQNSGTSTSNIDTSSASSPPNDRGRVVEGMTTAELVQILNSRLQPGQWTEDEALPRYPESQSGR